MHLIFKLPNEKLPFIGITFESEYSARTLNQHLVNNHKKAIYEGRLEPTLDGKLILTIVCHELGFTHSYPALIYCVNDFHMFLHLTTKVSEVNFSHIYPRGGKEIVVRTLDEFKLFVIKLDGFKFLVREDLTVSSHLPI